MTPSLEVRPSGETDWPYGGARWWKFDFHTHTPASCDYRKGPNHASERSVEPRDWLLGFMRARIDCVAVTDHNSGEWIDPLKKALTELEAERCSGFRPLWLFPGVELTANGGIHILAIMDTDKSSADIDNLIGSVGFRGARGASDTTAESSVIQMVEKIDKAGAVAIPAHVDQKCGLWSMKGNTLEPLLRSDKILAIEVTGTAESPAEHGKPARYDELGVRWAEVLGSDCHHQYSDSRSNAIGRRFTWVKMAEPSLQGLRLALLDGNEYSIGRSGSFDSPVLPQHHLQELEISEARLMGRGKAARVVFSPWLNAIVGGRGTGKSTIIHALRIVSRRSNELKQLDEHSSAKRTFERFDQIPKQRADEGGLTDDTQLSMIAVRGGVRNRVNWGHNSQSPPDDADQAPTVEELASDTWKPAEVQAVTPARFPLRILSQGQLAELADDQQALLHIIDEAASTAPDQESLEQATAAFRQTRGRIRELDQRLEREADTQVNMKDTERKLRSFADSGHADVLNTYRQRSRQREVLEQHFEVAAEAADRIDSTAGELHTEDLDRRTFADDSPENLAVVESITSLAQATEKATRELKQTAADLRAEVDSERSSLEQSQWRTALDEADAAYRKLIETLSAEGISDPDEYRRLVHQRSQLEGDLAALQSQAEERSRLRDQSEQELEKVFEARCAVGERRRAFLDQVLAGNEFVRMELRDFGDSGALEAIERSLRGALGAQDDRFERDILHIDGDERSGIVVDLVDELPAARDERRREFNDRIRKLHKRFTNACKGEGGFGGRFNKFLQKRHDETPEFLDRLLTWFPDDALCVEYNRSGRTSEFEPITQASAGQRAAAMLAFLLAHGEEPLVLDQPEDDLDNHLIYDLVVRQIRQKKLRRQIIAVTHNPNIVVNGDAEMVHALKFVEGQCRVVKSGSLQDTEIRDEICRVLEGGREAFERRYRRIAAGVSDV